MLIKARDMRDGVRRIHVTNASANPSFLILDRHAFDPSSVRIDPNGSHACLFCSHLIPLDPNSPNYGRFCVATQWHQFIYDQPKATFECSTCQCSYADSLFFDKNYQLPDCGALVVSAPLPASRISANHGAIGQLTTNANGTWVYTPGIAYTPPPAAFTFDNLFDVSTPDFLPPPTKPACAWCRIELSPYLDAYYGKDPVAATLCTNCRGRK